MKMIKVEKVRLRTEITVEHGWWIFSWKRTYRTQRHIVGRYFDWVALPNNTKVYDGIEFQLNVWKEIAEEDSK